MPLRILIVADPSVAGAALAIEEHSKRLTCLDVDGVALVVVVPQVQCPAIRLSCADGRKGEEATALC